MSRPYVVTISSDKGGVGKTTLATNLAIYLAALNQGVPVTLLSFDNHFTVDRMFRPDFLPDGRDVRGLFDGVPIEQLTVPGNYGVRYVPSSQDLSSLRGQAESPETLARTLTKSRLDGVLIIDTRPDLDVFTQNALYAADRVIVPVKDAPSMENCRHLFGFFEKQGLSRQTIRLLPCLIDQRVRYEGPFKDPFQLIRGYAINRGYPCYDLFITKSPKVETLGTNPSGKVFPILVEARGTEVHNQFCHLTKLIYEEIAHGGARRLNQAAASFETARQQQKQAFQQRVERVSSQCLLCGKDLTTTDAGAALFYGENHLGHAGFAEELCLANLVLGQFTKGRATQLRDSQLLDLFRESSQRSLFALHRPPQDKNRLDLFRFGFNGDKAHRATTTMTQKKNRLFGGPTFDFSYLRNTTLEDTTSSEGETLFLHQTPVASPTEILQEPNYRLFRKRVEEAQPLIIQS